MQDLKILRPHLFTERRSVGQRVEERGDGLPLLAEGVAVLVPLDVVQERALHADRDAVAAVGAEGDRVGSEAPAVEVAANPDGHIRDALGDEVVAGVDVEGPVLRRLDATREHQAVHQP